MKGWRVLVTGSSPEPLVRRLGERGARAVVVPTIAIRPVTDPAFDRALARAAAYDWIVVTSANGARAVLDRAASLGLEIPPGPRWAAVGPRTAATLEVGGIEVDHVPDRGTGAAIPEGMGILDGRRVLLFRARDAGVDLPAVLGARGAEVDDVAAYETVEGPEESRPALERALDEGVDAAIFTSGSTVRGLVRLAGDPGVLAGALVVCIGPSTAAVARQAGLAPAAVAAERTPAGLVAALERAAGERV